MKTILAPIDFSESARLVITEAARLARALDGRLVIMNVIPSLPATASEFGYGDDAARVASAAENDAANRLSLIQRQLKERGIVTTTLHVQGVPGPSIVSRAKEVAADFVVIGSHGHGALYDLIVGSTARRVINESICPVIVVPSGAKLTEDARALVMDPSEAMAV